MAIEQIARASKNINEGCGIYNATVTALSLEHTSAGAHNTTALASLGLNNHIKNLTSAEVDILDGATVSTAELNKLDGCTATAAELSILHGVTATAAELSILHGVTATAAELSILHGVTATAAELNILDGVTATAAELNILDGASSELTSLVDAEIQQLQNIGSATMSAAQWGYLGASGAGGGQLLAALTTGESTQLEAIGATTISAAQWGALGALVEWTAWTPTLTGGADLSGYDSARYFRIGDLCFFNFKAAGKNVTTAGVVEITLPFTCANTTGASPNGQIHDGTAWIGLPHIFIDANTNICKVYKDAAGANWAGTETGVTFNVSGFFEIA